MTQTEALAIMKSGKNVFLTGEPGAGKTYTLNQFIEQARQAHKRIAITASTGIAASHIDGMTIHSWSGTGIADSLSDEDMERMTFKHKLKQKYVQADILIIDEVSMLHGHRLDMVEKLCRLMRKREAPFGGLQVILVGDLFQLPPVSRDGQEVDFVHQSEAWLKLDLNICYLTEQHRQGMDDKLLDILRSMRNGGLSAAQKKLLSERGRYVAPRDATKLYTHNVDVDSMNRNRLAQLPGKGWSAAMQDDGNPYKVAAMKRSILAPEKLELKIDAEVMFVANHKEQIYVNGTRGKVIRFSNHGDPVVETLDGQEIIVEQHSWKTYDDFGQYVIASVTQYPLRLAWAVTVHKSQGMSLDEAEINLSQAFVPGMGYVALSRVRSLEGLYLKGLNETALEMDPDIYEFDKILKEGKYAELAGRG